MNLLPQMTNKEYELLIDVLFLTISIKERAGELFYYSADIQNLMDKIHDETIEIKK